MTFDPIPSIPLYAKCFTILIPGFPGQDFGLWIMDHGSYNQTGDLTENPAVVLLAS